MPNKITVSWSVWADGEKRFKAFKKKNGQDPNYVMIQNNEVSLLDWKDSQNRVAKFKIDYNVKPKTVTLTVPSTLKDNIGTDTDNDTIIPVHHFNQQNVGKGFGEYCCGVVASMICASAYNLVDRNNFMPKAYGLIEAMKTQIGSGTAPNNMVTGFNNFFTTLNMKEMPFTEENIRENIKKQVPMVVNLLTNHNLGYRGRFPHYAACTGYNGQVGISDPHGFNIGRGRRFWYDYKTIKQAVDNNGSRPLWVVVKN